MNPPSAPISRIERRRQRNRAALIEVATQLFQERGIRATKLEEICAGADVAPRTFFNHFKTREHLYQAIAYQRANQLAARIEEQALDERPFPIRLGELFGAIGAFLSERPAYRELVGEMLFLRLDGGNATVRGGSIGLATLHFIEAGIARGEIQARHRPETLADMTMGALTAALTNWCSDDGYDLEAGLVAASNALIDLFQFQSTAAPRS